MQSKGKTFTSQDQDKDMVSIEVCPLCKGQNFEFLHHASFAGKTCTNVICKDCTLVFQNPRPCEIMLADYYRDEYAAFLNRVSETKVDGPDRQAIRNATIKARRVFGFAEAYLSRCPSPSSILDIGSSAGILLNMFKERGFATFGVEPNKVYAEYARRHGHEIQDGVFSDSHFQGNHFDVVTLVHVLEHLPDPIRALSVLRSRLTENGMIVIEVPNVMRPNGHLTGFFQVPHLFTFSRATLLGMLRLAGFTTILTMDEAYPHLRVLAAGSEACRDGGSLTGGDDVHNYKDVIRYLNRFSRRYTYGVAPIQAVKRGLKLLMPKRVSAPL